MPEIMERNKVFKTPWFEIIAKTVSGSGSDAPYYSLQMPDYVSVVALTEEQEIILVRQYRPAIEDYTLELPSGHVDQGETPEMAALRELYEETGYWAEHAELLGRLQPDTGRLSNKLWCYFVSDAENRNPVIEQGIEIVICNESDLFDFIEESKFAHAINLACLLLAILKNKLR